MLMLAIMACGKAAAADKPNIVIINIDDLGYADSGPCPSRMYSSRFPQRDLPPRRSRLPICFMKRAMPRPVSASGTWAISPHFCQRTRALICTTAFPTPTTWDRWLTGPAATSDVLFPSPTGSLMARFFLSLVRRVSAGSASRDCQCSKTTVLPFVSGRHNSRRPSRAIPTGRSPLLKRTENGRSVFLYLAYSAVHFLIYPGEAFAERSPHGSSSDWVEEANWSVWRVLDAIRAACLAERVAKPEPLIPLQRDGLSTRASGKGD